MLAVRLPSTLRRRGEAADASFSLREAALAVGAPYPRTSGPNEICRIVRRANPRKRAARNGVSVARRRVSRPALWQVLRRNGTVSDQEFAGAKFARISGPLMSADQIRNEAGRSGRPARERPASMIRSASRASAPKNPINPGAQQVAATLARDGLIVNKENRLLPSGRMSQSAKSAGLMPSSSSARGRIDRKDDRDPEG